MSFTLTVMALLAMTASASFAQTESVSPGKWWPEQLEGVLSQSGTNRAGLIKALNEAPPAQQEGLRFLLQNMPLHDLRSLSASFLLEDVALAYEVRDQVPWVKAVPNDLFLNDVLPYASVSEQREAWRKSLYEKCAPLVKDCRTPAEAAQRLNQKLFGLVKVKYSTGRKKADQSPSESMASGLASCTGLAILLVDACRAVGVPARLAGTPNWADNRGNHTWVEIWDQRWHFTGAAEPDARGLDHAWFEADAARATKGSKDHAIYALSFQKTSLPFPMDWNADAEPVSAIDVTDRYAQPAKTTSAGKTRLLVKVQEGPGGKRVSAQVRVSDLADARFVLEGTSRDETHDANDVLSFEVPQERTYLLQVESGGRKATGGAFRCRTNAQELVVLFLVPAAADSALANQPLRPAEAAKLKKELTAFFKAEPEKQAHWKFAHSLDVLLEKNESAVRQAAWEAYRAAPIHGALQRDYQARQVRFDANLSPYTVRAIGQKPANGWPLFISMHGGGGAPKEVNDSQWKVMQHYYHDQTSVPGYLYLALRAPNDTWNGFYDDYVYPLVANLIRQFLLFGEVDPDKVFLIGYSHGGYGAFAIGPKMPDRFAAIHASAAAPTDGETSAKTLRNTVFTYMVGENDHAYGRIERCQAFAETINQLRGERTDIYPVTLEYEEGFGHTGLPDKDEIKNMYPAVRNPVPAELTWEMTDKVIRDFFWLQVPQPGKKQEIRASCLGNHFRVTTAGVRAANLLVDSRLIDFKQPLILEVNGRQTTCRVKPSLLTLCQTLLERGDPQLAFSARVEVVGR